jgi:hypothetical protein
MQFRSRGLGRDKFESATVAGRWIFLYPAVLLAAAACAGEEREPAGSSVKTGAAPSPSKGADGSASAATARALKEKRPAAALPRPGAADRVAVADQSPGARSALEAATPPARAGSEVPLWETPIARARHTIAGCQARYQEVTDYTCTFYKRERIAGRLTPLHIMTMKVRTKPQSIYLKFQQPARGREAIYVAGRRDGKLQAHDVGLNRLLAGTLELLPTSARAMEDCRHPITEAGIGPLLETLSKRWALELNPEESVLVFRDDMSIGPVRCLMIESTHPEHRPQFLYYRVRVFIDQELGLPIRFEAYDWPARPNAEPELAEEYSYTNLKLNVGLGELDFDVSNRSYSFGRF